MKESVPVQSSFGMRLSPVRWGQVARLCLNIFVLLAAAVGVASMLNEAKGDPPLPAFRSLHQTAPHLMPHLHRNPTAGWSARSQVLNPTGYWAGLQSSLAILRAINPSIALWLEDMHAHQRIRYRLLPLQKHVFGGQTYLSADPNQQVLRIGNAFWELPDWEKAAFLAHEYRHFRQNRAKMLASILSQLLSGQFRTYGSLLEDEAFLYQAEAYRAMGMPMVSVTPYLQRRNLLHFQPDSSPTLETARMPRQ